MPYSMYVCTMSSIGGQHTCPAAKLNPFACMHVPYHLLLGSVCSFRTSLDSEVHSTGIQRGQSKVSSPQRVLPQTVPVQSSDGGANNDVTGSIRACSAAAVILASFHPFPHVPIMVHHQSSHGLNLPLILIELRSSNQQSANVRHSPIITTQPN